jgi:hypothetical protein
MRFVGAVNRVLSQIHLTEDGGDGEKLQ